MFNRVQRTTSTLLAIAALCVATAMHVAAGSAVTVTPLIGDPSAGSYCQAALDAIAAAERTIDVLLSSVSLEDNPIPPALAAAAGRGVVIRVLLDASDWAPDITNKNQPSLAYFLEHGIEARFDDEAVTLHAKLMVVDGETVLVGSSNWNRYALTEHRQADVMIKAISIGAFYAHYFDLLWCGRLTDQEVEVPLPDDFGVVPTILPLADVPDSASYANVLLELLQRARQSIHVSMYRVSYYSGYADSLANEILAALIDAAHRGLDVRVLLDDCAYYQDSADANLTSAIFLHQRGLEVRLDEASLTTHAKLVVIDGQTVLLGSTNWNYYSLEKNCETDVAFVCLPAIAAPFEAYFETLWASGRDLGI